MSRFCGSTSNVSIAMTFSREWETEYTTGRSGSVWPWSDLVSYVMRYARPQKKPFRVLELGSGVGANIPFFLSLGAEYYAIEGSEKAIERTHARFPQLRDTVAVGDFTAAIPFDVSFDLIVDRASLTHNTEAAIRRCLKLVSAKLVSGGVFVGIDWFSTAHSDFVLGEGGGDAYTRTHITEGQFKGVGIVHFSDERHLLDLFHSYEIIKLEHKIVMEAIPAFDHRFAAWNFAARKRS